MLRPTGLELFKGVSVAEQERISRLCAERRYPRGTTIFSEGDPSDSVFILVEGLVELFSVSPKGGETILYILKPDEIFGELLFSEERRAFNAVGSTDVIVTVIPRRNFKEILKHGGTRFVVDADRLAKFLEPGDDTKTPPILHLERLE